MKTTLKLTIIVAMFYVGLMLMVGTPLPNTSMREWAMTVASGAALVGAAAWLFATWNSTVVEADDSK
jgi:hypothetical protein